MIKPLIVLLCSLLFSACSAPQKQAGGSDMPNGMVAGIVASSAGTVSAGAELTLKSIVLSADGFTSITEKSVTADNSGQFQFSNVEKGTYILSAKLKNGETAVLSRITKNEESLEDIEVKTSTVMTVRGHVLGNYGKMPKRVFIAGTKLSAPVSADGSYRLDSVPTGELELSFSGGSELSVLQVTVIPDTSRDTVTLRDCEFNDPKAALYNLHASAVPVLETYPLLYSDGSEPLWYQGTDFSGVLYEKSSVADPRELWEFPAEISVTPLLLDQFGSMENLKKALYFQFGKVNSLFSDSCFNGKIVFTADSVRKFSSADTVQLPGSRFSLRLVLAAKSEIDSVKEWRNAIRTAVLPVSASNQMFSDSALSDFCRVLAQSRGALALDSCGYGKGSDALENDTSFCRPSLLMWDKNGTEFDKQTIGIVNAGKAVLRPSFLLYGTHFPARIGIQVNKNGAPLAGATVIVYRLYKTTRMISQTSYYVGQTNSDGVYELPENPFLSGGGVTTTGTLLFEVSKDKVFNYCWMPYYEPVGTKFSGKSDIHISRFTLQ